MSDEVDGTAKGVMSSALLLAAVGAILVAGLMLRTSGSDGDTARPVQAPPPAMSLPLGATVGSEVAPEAPNAESATPAEAPDDTPAVAVVRPPSEPVVALAPSVADPLLLALARRAATDSARLQKARERFTAQLLVACKPETVDRLLDTARGSTNIYVLPAQIHDEACFRVCFGTYATSKDAAAAADLPETLRGKDKVAAIAIAKVLP